MSFHLTQADLMIISDSLTNYKDDEFVEELNEFVSKNYDDYYFYCRETTIENFMEITITQLGRIISYVDSREFSALNDLLNAVYQGGLLTGQKSLFLYGRKKD